MSDSSNQTLVRCAMYLRSATDDRASLLVQEEVCRFSASRHEPSWEIRDEFIFTDSPSSGRDGHDRPGLAALLKTASGCTQPFKFVLVASPDRLGRNLDTVLQTIDMLTYHGVDVHIASMGLNSSDPDFRKLFIFGVQCEENRVRALREKVSRTHLAIVQSGGSVGGRHYGYRSRPIEFPVTGRSVSRAAKLSVHDEEAVIVRDIFRQFANGKRVSEIAHNLNSCGVPGPGGRIWKGNSIRRILRNRRYRGTVIWNRTRRVRNPRTGQAETRQRPDEQVVEVAVPELRIVDDELAANVDARLGNVESHVKSGS